MKLFQAVQNHYQHMGICSPIQNTNSLNIRNLAFLFAMFLVFVSSTGAILFIELSIILQAQTFAVSVSEITATINVLTSTWKRAEIFNLIETLEAFIEKSEPQKR